MKKKTDLNTRIKDLRMFLFAQVLTVPLVIAIFKFIEPRNYAGLVAGAMFIAVGSFLVIRNFQWVHYKWSPTFWLSCVHLFAIALPMFVFRIPNLHMPFEELLIFGLPGPVLHKISEKVFMALVLVTFLELTRARYKLASSN